MDDEDELLKRVRAKRELIERRKFDDQVFQELRDKADAEKYKWAREQYREMRATGWSDEDIKFVFGLIDAASTCGITDDELAEALGEGPDAVANLLQQGRERIQGNNQQGG